MGFRIPKIWQILKHLSRALLSLIINLSYFCRKVYHYYKMISHFFPPQDNLLFHHLFEDGQKPTSKANPSGLAISNIGRVSHSYRDHSCVTSTSLSSTLKGLPEVSSPKISQVPAINVTGSSLHSSGPSSSSDLISSSFRFREFR